MSSSDNHANSAGVVAPECADSFGVQQDQSPARMTKSASQTFLKESKAMMAESPELSIIVPVYNVERYLGECMDSIHHQLFTNWECIVIDDKSTDRSGAICDAYANADARFRVIHHMENVGVSAARNKGIGAATAPLLTFVDADDFISPNFFDVLIKTMEQTGADVAVAHTFFVDEDGTEGPYSYANSINPPRHREMRDRGEVVAGVCSNAFSCVCWGKVYRRGLWGAARFPKSVDLGEDMMTVPAVIIKAGAAVVTESATYFWRQRKRSLLHGTVTWERYKKDLWASEQMVKQLTACYPELEKDFRRLKRVYDLGCEANYLQG